MLVTIKKQYMGLISLCLMVAVINIDFTAVNLALPKIVNQFCVPISKGQFMFSLYLFAASAFFMLGGKLVDTYQEKVIYLLGIILFLFASLVIILSQNFNFICIFRVLQGIGYAFIFPTSMLIADRLLPGEGKFSGISLIILISMLSQALGPSLGGILVDLGGWKSIFYINIGISILSGALFLTFQQSQASSKAEFIDLKGIGLFYSLFIGIPALLIVGGKSYFIYLPILIGGLLISYQLYQHSQQTVNPFIELKLFKNPSFLNSCLLRMGFNICWAFIVAYPPLYLQNVLGYSASMTGFIIIIFTIISAAATGVAEFVISYLGKFKALFLSFSILFGMHLISLLFMIKLSITYIVCLLAIYGIACGLLLPILTKITIEALDEKTKGQGLGVFYTMSLISMGAGTYLLSIVLETVAKLFIESNTSSLQLTYYKSIILGSTSLYDLQGQIDQQAFSKIQEILVHSHNTTWTLVSCLSLGLLGSALIICWSMERHMQKKEVIPLENY